MSLFLVSSLQGEGDKAEGTRVCTVQEGVRHPTLLSSLVGAALEGPQAALWADTLFPLLALPMTFWKTFANSLGLPASVSPAVEWERMRQGGAFTWARGRGRAFNQKPRPQLCGPHSSVPPKLRGMRGHAGVLRPHCQARLCSRTHHAA